VERAVYTVVGILTLMLVAGGLTQVTLAMKGGSLWQLGINQPPATVASPTPTPSATPAVTPEPTPEPTATPEPTPEQTPPPRTATVVSYVRFRAGPSVATAILGEFNGGEVVILGAYSDAQWQEATYNGTRGFIYKTYLRY
jgi:hypothetical protein